MIFISPTSIIWCIGHELKIPGIVRAEGCFLYDLNGRRYVDLESGVWCTCLGHGHPGVNQVIKDQIDRISHTGYCYINPVIEESAGELLELLEFKKGKCVFLSSGSEAVEFAVRTAKAIMNRPLMLMFSDSYFGAYGSASQRASDEWFIFDWLECRNCVNFDTCDPECPKFKEIPFERIGAFLLEPGSSSGLIRFPSNSLIGNTVRAIKEKEGLLVINEITTGIGRTGKWFGYQHYDLKPDIVAMGKGLGNGYPVSVTAVTEEVSRRLSDTSFRFSQSHQNDPLGAAVAGAVIRIIRDEHLVERSRTLGKWLYSELDAIAKRQGIIQEVRGRGMMIAIEFKSDVKEHHYAPRIYDELLNNGFIVSLRPGVNVLRMDPCLTIPEKELRSFLQEFEGIMNMGSGIHKFTNL